MHVGPDYFKGFDFGAAVRSASALRLQKALRALGLQTKDNVLLIAADGIVGPKTTAAANRAFVRHIDPSAPARFRTGRLTQADVAQHAAAMAGAVETEVRRRSLRARAAVAARRPGVRPPTARPAAVRPPAARRPTVPAVAARRPTAPPAAREPAPGPPTAPAKKGLPGWAWALIGLGSLVLVGGTVALIVAGGKGTAAESAAA